MQQLITSPNKDPLGAMLQDYLNGDKKAYVRVSSPNLDMWEMTGEIMFRNFMKMSILERKALSLCSGRILDVGAGSGCHTLVLQNRNLEVHALDISPGCIEVMKKRKVRHPLHNNLFGLRQVRYDTILMLMNGIGICGSIDGLNLFFQFVRDILQPDGRILVDSTDLAALYPPENLQPEDGRYYGETRFSMTYNAISGDDFDWLYIDFETLSFYAGFHGFACEKIMSDRSHRYLARLSLEQ
jgi:SAM-dependent methyltransferase